MHVPGYDEYDEDEGGWGTAVLLTAGALLVIPVIAAARAGGWVRDRLR